MTDHGEQAYGGYQEALAKANQIIEKKEQEIMKLKADSCYIEAARANQTIREQKKEIEEGRKTMAEQKGVITGLMADFASHEKELKEKDAKIAHYRIGIDDLIAALKPHAEDGDVEYKNIILCLESIKKAYQGHKGEDEG